jgi:hypothetical protein
MLKPSTISDNNPERSFTTADRMARLLGWFSIGLGLAELIAPGRIAKAVGLEGKEGLLRAYGGREIASGVGALSVDAGPAMWSRVAGDLIDLGTLASGARKAPDEDQRRYAGYAIAAVVGVTLLDLFVASTLTKQRSRSRGESRDYSNRSGFPGGAAQARGAANDFQTPPEYRAAPRLAAASPTTTIQ